MKIVILDGQVMGGSVADFPTLQEFGDLTVYDITPPELVIHSICYTMELDERYASVIVDRYIQFHEGASQNVKVIRDGTELSYEEAVAETRAAE